MANYLQSLASFEGLVTGVTDARARKERVAAASVSTLIKSISNGRVIIITYNSLRCT